MHRSVLLALPLAVVNLAGSGCEALTPLPLRLVHGFAPIVGQRLARQRRLCLSEFADPTFLQLTVGEMLF